MASRRMPPTAPPRRRVRLLVAGALLATATVWAAVALQSPEGVTRDTPARAAPSGAADAGAERWLKGQLHAHSSNSGDGRTAPADVLRWYDAHGYDFVVFTDHDHVTVAPGVGGVLSIPGVELTQNYRTCEPPPEPGLSCLLHVNALFVDPAKATPRWPPETGGSRAKGYEGGIDAARALGGLAQVNHPNFHYGADAALLARLGRHGATFVEVANEAVDSNNGGDAQHPSTEALWDAVLSQGVRLWGTATDDAHHFYDAQKVRAAGEQAFVGDRGFVVVRARKEPASIRAALERGDFHASTGVRLSRVERAPEGLHLEVAPESEGEHTFVFTGGGGEVLGTVRGRTARFPLTGVASPYVRATVTGSTGHKAWTQPVFLTR